MSAAQQLRQEGRREERKEGMQKVAKSMLQEGLTLQFIKKITGLTGQELGRLK
jgi:predicted transposase/invertase (TIGR01784 family)